MESQFEIERKQIKNAFEIQHEQMREKFDIEREQMKKVFEIERKKMENTISCLQEDKKSHEATLENIALIRRQVEKVLDTSVGSATKVRCPLRSCSLLLARACLRRHSEKQHERYQLYSCRQQDCILVFKNEGDLQDHMDCHEKGSLSRCSVCEAWFIGIGDLHEYTCKSSFIKRSNSADYDSGPYSPPKTPVFR